MKVNGTQGEYLPVSQGVHSDEDETHLAATKGSVNAIPIKNGALESAIASKDLEEAKSSEKSEKAPMSPLRKVCFVLSLLQCALFIIAFGWLIPCKLPRYLESPAKNWEYSLSYDIATNFDFVKLDKKSGSILFGYQSPSNASVNGFTSINALDGSPVWNMSFYDSPASLVCGDGFRTSPDGPPMCIAVGKSGRMASFRVSDGHTEWYAHNHNKTWAPSELSIPSIGSDCDNDTIDEIYVAGVDTSGFVLYIISGSTGQVLNTVLLTTCTSLPKKIIPWFYENQQHVIFSCMDKTGFENVWSVPMDNLCGKNTGSVDSISFDSLDTRTLHSLEKDNSLLDIISVAVSESKKDYHQVLITKNGHIVQLLNTDNETAWTYDLPANLVLIGATSGRFLNNSVQCVALLAKDSTDSKLTTLIIIEEKSGQPIFNHTFINQTATSFYSISDANDGKDGLLVRTLSSAIEDLTVKTEDLATKDGSKSVGDSNEISNVEEKFLILKCDKSISFEPLLMITQSAVCGKDGCKPDLYASNQSVLLSDMDGDGNVELVQTVTVPSNNLESDDIQTNLKLSRLSTAPLSCSSCGCS